MPISVGSDEACGSSPFSVASSVSVAEACCAPPPPRLIPLTENLEALLDIKLPIPPLQLAIEDLIGVASTTDDEVVEVVDTAERVEIRLSGLNPDSVGTGVEAGEGEAEYSAPAPDAPVFDPGSDSFRWVVNRLIPPLTPSTARKKPVDPATRAFVSVSRAGASC